MPMSLLVFPFLVIVVFLVIVIIILIILVTFVCIFKWSGIKCPLIQARPHL